MEITMSDEISKTILLLCDDTDLSESLKVKLVEKGAKVYCKESFDAGSEFLDQQRVSHVMIDICFSVFQKAKFIKNLKKLTIIIPKIKTISFREILNKFNPTHDKFVISGGDGQEDHFSQEINRFIMGDALDISQNFSQLYEKPLKTFVQLGQVSSSVEFLEITKTGMVVFSPESAKVGDQALVKIENFMNKVGSVIEINAKIKQCEQEDETCFIELELDLEFISEWNLIYEEYVERQIKIEEFMHSQKY
jgi:hypothetical protein